MKNFKNYIACMTIFALLFTSCSKDDENGTAPGSEKATLSFGTVLNNLVSNRSALKQQFGNIPNCSDDLPAYVEVVLSRDGVSVVGTTDNPLRVNFNPNPGDYDGDGEEEYFTEESGTLELEPGTYTLEYFTVLNAEENRIWVAPIQEENINFAGFVDNPLPMEFSLSPGVKKYLNVEVLCFDDRLVNYYGYLFFDIEGAEAIKFCIFGNYCDENGRHAEAVSYNVSVWNYSGNAEAPQGEVLYENMGSGIFIEDDFENGIATTYSVPLCFALPDNAGLDEYYFEITLLSGVGYNVEEHLIRSGVITDEDVRELFDGENNVDYYHFREGNCNMEDSPNLFEVNNIVSPTIINSTTEENVTMTSIIFSGEIIQGSSQLLGHGIIWSENPNPTFDDNQYPVFANPFNAHLSGFLTPGQTYYYKIYAITAEGNFFSDEMSFTTPSLAGTKWDFHFLHNDELNWHADVTFYEDGTVFYTEPAYPGVYDSWGTWSLEGNILTYDIEGDGGGHYILTGKVESDKKMSGTYTYLDRNPAWVAEKYD